MDPFFLAVSRFNRQKFDECIAICSTMLEKNPYDQVNSNLIKSLIVTRLHGYSNVEHSQKRVGSTI